MRMLFHSDYKDWKPEDVLGWQQYELFHDRVMTEMMAQSGRAKSKGAPHRYLYAQGGLTTLFSRFQWVLQNYLN